MKQLKDINEELYLELAKRHGVSYEEVWKFFDTLFNLLYRELNEKEFDKISIAKFGSFEKRYINLPFLEEYIRQPEEYRKFYGKMLEFNRATTNVYKHKKLYNELKKQNAPASTLGFSKD